MAFCTKCGTETNGKFCPICGSMMPAATPSFEAPAAPLPADTVNAPAATPVYEAPATPAYEQPPVYAPPYAAKYMPPAPPEKKQNTGMIIAGLAIGAAALTFFWVPVLGLVLAIPGLVLAIIGFVKAHPKKGLPLAAFIVACVAMMLSLVMNLAYLEEELYMNDYSYYDDGDYYDDYNDFDFFDEFDYYT